MPSIEHDPIIKNALMDNYNSYAQGLDTKNWPLVRACFADEVLIDYGAISAPTGHPDVPRRADDWLKMLQSVINGFDITRHTITNHRIVMSGEKIGCRAYLKADHIIFPNPEVPIIAAEDVVTVVGEYTNYYEQLGGLWKIVQSELVVNWTEGNLSLLGTAAERVAAQLQG